jgi:DNA-binding NarL/FixJ family response regulator
MSEALPVDVILLRLPPLLSDIVRQLVDGEEDMQVLAEIAAARELLQAARAARGRVVVLTAGDAPSRDLLELLPDLPRARALAVSDDGRRAVLCELEPRCSALPETSPEEIVRAIRRDGWASSV